MALQMLYEVSYKGVIKINTNKITKDLIIKRLYNYGHSKNNQIRDICVNQVDDGVFNICFNKIARRPWNTPPTSIDGKIIINNILSDFSLDDYEFYLKRWCLWG